MTSVAQAANAAIPNVSIEDQKEFMKRIREVGRDAGAGAAARVKAFRMCVEGAMNGVIDTEDAKEIATAYSESADGKNRVEYKTTNSTQANTSKFRTAIKLGMLPSDCGLDLTDRVLDRIKDLTQAGNKLGGSAFEKLVSVARKQIDQPEVTLTDTDIDNILLPAEQEAKGEIDLLKDLVNKCKRVHDGKKDTGDDAHPSQELADAIKRIEERLHTLEFVKKEEDDAIQLAAIMERQKSNERIKALAAQLTAEPVALIAAE